MEYSEVECRLYLVALLEGIEHRDVKLLCEEQRAPVQYIEEADALLRVKAGAGHGAMERVASPFTFLKTEEKKGAEAEVEKKPVLLHYGRRALTLDKNFMPLAHPDGDDSVAELWQKLADALAAISAPKGSRLYLTYALEALHHYAVTVPNPTGMNPDVSWYDHAKLRAGIAVCLYRNDAPLGAERLLLVRADVSGIQEFIGSISSKFASKSLKGRSFYIQLLADAVLRKTLKTLALFEGNVIYGSGGNFFLIAPNTPATVAALEALEAEISAALFKAHQARLSMILGWVPVGDEDVKSEKLKSKIDDLFDKVIAEKKKRKFHQYIEANFGLFFGAPKDVGGRAPTDAVTGEELDMVNDIIYFVGEDAANPRRVTAGEKEIKDGEHLISSLTNSYIALGRKLKDVAAIWVSDRALSAGKSELHLNPCNLGIHYYLVQQKGGISPPDVEHIAINQVGVSNASLLMYGGKGVPVFEESGYETMETNAKGVSKLKTYSKGDFKDFSHLALTFLKDAQTNEIQRSDDTGLKLGRYKRLGVLKMDVDGLGTIFKEKIVRPTLTLSCYAALSRNLDWFFKGYLNTLWKHERLAFTDDAYRDYSQIIYSGGDDLFIVGRWDVMIDFAEKIRSEFEAFTGAPSVSLSGGVAIVTDKYPIMKASALASEAESEAKGHKYVEGGVKVFEKNSFSLFRMPLHWEHEYETVKRLKGELMDYLRYANGGQGNPVSLLHKIQRYAAMAREYDAAEQRHEAAPSIHPAPTPRWVWLSVYDLSRFRDRLKGDENKKYREMIKCWESEIFTSKVKRSDYRFIHLLDIAARWAELEYRSVNNK